MSNDQLKRQRMAVIICDEEDGLREIFERMDAMGEEASK
jgi:nitrogen-specific signal transduction histidine kinase